MSVKEWLPITRRNRVALGLAALALVMFVVWNCLPLRGASNVLFTLVWPFILSPDVYEEVLRSPNIGGFMLIGAFLSLIKGAILILLAVPFWRVLHASPLLRIPFALVNLFGGLAVLQSLLDEIHYPMTHSKSLEVILMAGSLLTISAALFLFRNELALREERNRPMTQ